MYPCARYEGISQSLGTPPRIPNLGTRWNSVISVTLRPFYPRGKKRHLLRGLKSRCGCSGVNIRSNYSKKRWRMWLTSLFVITYKCHGCWLAINDLRFKYPWVTLKRFTKFCEISPQLPPKPLHHNYTKTHTLLSLLLKLPPRMRMWCTASQLRLQRISLTNQRAVRAFEKM
jgi:hypothetical protein